MNYQICTESFILCCSVYYVRGVLPHACLGRVLEDYHASDMDKKWKPMRLLR
jgi:hypothetical protein